MDCIDTNTLEAWLDGELPPGRAAVVEAHVNDCAACHAFVAATRAAGDRLRSASVGTPPADAHWRWAAAMGLTRERQVRRLAGWMTAAAAFVLAVTLPAVLSNPAEAWPTRPTAQTAMLAGPTDWEAAAVGNGDDPATPQAQARLIAVDLALAGPAGVASPGGEGAQ